MSELLFWLYFANAVLLVIHEIDSAYWKEWDLFRLPGGISLFLLLHFPMIILILWGLIQVYEKSFAGLLLSLVLGCGGVFAFSIHTYFIRKGRPEFKTSVSLGILIGTLLVSLVQVPLALQAIFRGAIR